MSLFAFWLRNVVRAKPFAGIFVAVLVVVAIGVWYLTDTGTVVILNESHGSAHVTIDTGLARSAVHFNLEDGAKREIKLYAWKQHTIDDYKVYDVQHAFSDPTRNVALKRGEVLIYVISPPSGSGTVNLENLSEGTAAFWVDGKYAGEAPPSTHITIELTVWQQHMIRAVDFYGPTETYATPTARVWPSDGDVYRYLACGETGTPGENCGLFSLAR